MYEEFYRLSRRPFLTVPDPEFLLLTESHSLALTMLRYGMMTRAPISVITGEIGAGKTTLLRQTLREVPPDVVIGFISNMQADRGLLLQWILMALGERVEDTSYVQLFSRFQDLVIGHYAEGRRVTLVFDEAQNLDVSTLEELRMLSNINSDGDELLQLVLVGQPQLRELLARPELVQFSQRISVDFHLPVLEREEVARYINHRLMVADAQWRIFPPETCSGVYEATRGVPRLINVLCDLCLVYGYVAEAKTIGLDLLEEFLASAHKRGIYEQFSPLRASSKILQQVR